MFLPLRKYAVWAVGVLFVLCWGASVAAAGMVEEPMADEELSLARSIQIALSRNPRILSSLEEIKAAENIKKKAFSQFFFKVRGAYSYTQLQETPTLQAFDIPGGPTELPVGTRDNFNFEGVVEQPLFTGFSLLTSYQLSKLGFDIAKVRSKIEKLNLIRDVKIAYFNVLRAEKGIIVAEQAVRQLESQVKRARDFYEVGMTPKNDYLKAQVELANARQNLIVANNALRLAKAEFNTLLRLPVERPLRVQDILQYNPFLMKLEEAYQKAHALRPELVEAELSLEAALKEVKLAQAGYYPTLALNFTYKRFGDTYKLKGSPFQEQETWSVTTALDWTFWEWGSTKHEVAEKRNRVKQAKYALQALQDAVDLEVKQAYLVLRESEKNISVTEKSIEQAEENYRMEVERYKQQVNTNTDVLDAQFLLTRARNNYYDALYRYNIAVANLQRAMGLAE